MRILTDCGQTLKLDKHGFPEEHFDIQVTQEHIDKGVAADCERCPIAWSLSEFSETNFLKPWEVYIDPQHTTIILNSNFHEPPEKRAAYFFEHDHFVKGWIEYYDHKCVQNPTAFRFITTDKPSAFIIKEVGMK